MEYKYVRIFFRTHFMIFAKQWIGNNIFVILVIYDLYSNIGCTNAHIYSQPQADPSLVRSPSAEEPFFISSFYLSSREEDWLGQRTQVRVEGQEEDTS